MCKIKASKLVELFDMFDAYRYTPADEGVIYGCDCGCGGDCYDNESWDEAFEMSEKTTRELREALESLGVEWDLD